MALRPQGFDEEEDEDLEALRLAALQTLKTKSTSPVKPIPVPSSAKTKNDSPTLPAVSRRPRNDFNRGGMRGRHQNAGFQRHWVNPNLIAIVPINESSPSSSSDTPAVKTTKPSLVVNSASPKLILPQNRYCKTEEVTGEKQPEVSTKFDRFEHSSSESSAEEESADEEEVEGEKEEDREKSLERGAQDEEEEQQQEEENAEESSDAEPDPDVLLVKDEDDDDSLEKLMNEMEVELADDDDETVPSLPRAAPRTRPRSQRSQPSSSATSAAATASPSPSTGAKEKQPSPDSCSAADPMKPSSQESSAEGVHRRAAPSSSPSRPSERRSLRSRSRSPPLTRRDALWRSRSPLSLSPLPRRKSSYSPVPACSPLPCRRSRSPRSPRRSRSPPPLARTRKYSPASGHRPSPRHPSPSRWNSPRRQSVSPKFRRQSTSPCARGSRRSVTPPIANARRPSPVSYRRRSPSPPRRNLSPPPRRYSPPRRNPSPPRRRASRSPPSPPRRRRLSPSDPGGGRKPSPWSPVRMGRSSPHVRRSPPVAANAYKRKSPSASSPPYGRRRRSDSPGRRGASDEKRLHRAASPARGRRPLQESRLNNIRVSCSSSGDLPDPSPPSALPPSPSEKNWSCTSSLSLSPSPERALGEAPRRVRSPLRVQRKRNDFAWDADATPEDQIRKQPKRHKDKSKSRKRRGRVTTTAATAAVDGSNTARTRTPNSTAENTPANALLPRTQSDSSGSAVDSVLEARRKKFESVLPIESSNKKIRLRKEAPATECPRPEPPAHVETLPQTEDLEELLDLELENAVDLWGMDESDCEDDDPVPVRPNPQKAASAAPVAAAHVGRQEAKIRVVPLYKLQGLGAKPLEQEAKGRFQMNQDNDWEQESQLKTLEENERESFGVSEKLDLEQRRTRIDLLNVNVDVNESSETGSGKDGDLRAELSRRRAERLTMAGSVHETLPTRLVQSAFKDAVGKKNFRKLDRERHMSKRSDNPKGIEGTDGRRVLVLKSPAVEHVPSISVTIPKEEKSKREEIPVPGGKLPIRMRLGLPGGGGGGSAGAVGCPEGDRERQPGRRGSSRKVKLKRDVLLASPAGMEKVMCGSSLSLTLGSMRHSLLCSVPTFPSPLCGLRGIWSDIYSWLNNVVATRQTVQMQDTTECEISIQGNEKDESYCSNLYRCIFLIFCLPQLILKNYFHPHTPVYS